MYSHRARSNIGDAPWTSHYNEEYAPMTPWYDYVWHRYGKITRRKFDQLQIGMSRQEVIDIVGGPGRVISESQTGNIHLIIVKYLGRFWSPNPATLTFYNGFLRSKSRY